MSEDGYSSIKELFEDSTSEVSIKEVFEDSASEVGDPDGNVSSVSVGFSTPVKRRVRVIAPRPSKVAARFSGGSLDRRWCNESRRRFGFESPAGDLELPASSTWSNNVRRGGFRDAHRSLQASTSWDVSPISRVDVKEALSRKGRRNHRAVAEQLVGRFTSREDREAEKRLGLGRGHFASKVWQDYGRKMGKRVCGSCMGACCGALHDFIGRLVESDFLDAESQSPNVSVWLFIVLLY